MLPSSPDFDPHLAGTRLAVIIAGGAMATRSLEERVTALEETVAGLKNLPNELAEFRRETNARFAQIDARFVQIDARFAQVDARFDRLEQRMTTDKAELYAHMRMLHEELIERISVGREVSEGAGGSGAQRQSRRRPKR